MGSVLTRDAENLHLETGSSGMVLEHIHSCTYNISIYLKVKWL